MRENVVGDSECEGGEGSDSGTCALLVDIFVFIAILSRRPVADKELVILIRLGDFSLNASVCGPLDKFQYV